MLDSPRDQMRIKAVFAAIHAIEGHHPVDDCVELRGDQAPPAPRLQSHLQLRTAGAAQVQGVVAM